MSLTFPALPFASDALEPFISARTLAVHHGKHHRAYVDKVNDSVMGTSLATASLPEIVQSAAEHRQTALFNAAAQAWNHEFQWKCLTPAASSAPQNIIRARIEAEFGSYETFSATFLNVANSHFGSGWAWLVAERGALRIVTTSNADTPIVHAQLPLFVIDLWEHAYYLDHQNRRADYITAILGHLANWDFANRALQLA